ncbi:MAG TPA: hypothetical protein ENI05_06215 [Porticoccus sp.]|nr:hypothetical protein [Porticoccus sp.]
MPKTKEPKLSTLDRLKFTANWLACSSQSLRPDEIVLGGRIYDEGLAMLLGEDGPPVVRIHEIPIKKLKKNDRSFAFVYHNEE